MNDACVLKHLWWIASKKDNLWVKWVHRKYLKHESICTFRPPNDCSWIWRKISKVRDFIEPHVLHINGDERDTRLWLDQWHYDGVLVKQYGEGVRHTSGRSKDCKVVEIVVNGVWYPGHAGSILLRNVWSSLPMIEKLPGECNDIIVWKANSKGVFPTKSAWSLIRQHATPVTWSSVVWCTGFIPKHSFVSWKALHGKLPT